MPVATEPLQTQVYFLKRSPLYNEEKPYSLRFTPPSGFPRANIVLECHDITIEDTRATKDDLSLEKNGFAIMNLDTTMEYDQFDDEQIVKDTYLRELSDALRVYLKASHVQVFEHTVSPGQSDDTLH